MTRRTFAVRWVAAALSGWVVVALFLPPEPGLPAVLLTGGYVAITSILLASHLPRILRAGGTWVTLALVCTVPFLPGDSDPLYAVLFGLSWSVILFMTWMALAVSAITLLRLAGALPRARDVAAPAYGS